MGVQHLYRAKGGLGCELRSNWEVLGSRRGGCSSMRGLQACQRGEVKVLEELDVLHAIPQSLLKL